MNSQARRIAVMVIVVAFTGLVRAADPRFGELPAGSVSTSETHAVAAEICRDHLFDPSIARARLPKGFRLVLASEIASKERALGDLLQGNPAIRSHALGSLCFLSVGKLVVDDMPVKASYPLPAAFWWASVEGPRHTDMRGKTSWVQLASWYPKNAQDRSAILKIDPMAEFVAIDVKQIEPNRWRLSLALPGETVTAEVIGSGRRVPSRAAQPGYMSVPMSGDFADQFTVYTYSGHQHQNAQGTWRAIGSGVFSDALSIHGEASAFTTLFQDGWVSRSGLYRSSGK